MSWLTNGTTAKGQESKVPPLLRIPAERSDSSARLRSPVNSTLEIRVARRPWLLEKLTTPSPKPSIKMTPPRPPASISDPPSISLVVPENGNGWVTRGRVTSRVPVYADLKQESQQPTTEETDSSTPTPQTSPETTPSASTTPPTDDTSQPNASVPTKGDAKGDTKGDPVVTSKGVVTSKDTDKASKSGPDEVKPETERPSTHKSAELKTESTPESSDSDSQPAEDKPAEDKTADSKPAEKPESESPKSASSEKDQTTKQSEEGEGDVVKVRKLRLQSDGTVTDKSGLAASESAKLKAEEKVKNAPLSLYVGSDNPEATKIDYTGRPATPLKLTRNVARMQNTIKQTLLYYHARPESSNERSNWGVLHSIMVFGVDTKIRVKNRHYSAIAWIAGNNACRGQRLLTIQNDAIAARSGVGLQGHQAQLLAVFSLCDVPIDYPVYANNEKFSLREIVESEMLACRSGEELTFSLIGLSHYLDTETIWLNADGETWSFERLIREELRQPIVGAACGGTHRLMGFSHALRKRRAEGKPITGQWKRAEIFMNDFQKYAYRLQNRDGSMSTDWFEGREDNGDTDRKIQTTGHMVEWLLTITPDDKLQDQRLVNAVRFLANTMYSERGHDWKIGPKGHALRSLAMYYNRVYGGKTAWQPSSMAKSNNKSRR